MNRNKTEYEQGYRDGYQDGVEVPALALACRLYWSIEETMEHVPSDIDAMRLHAALASAGIPETDDKTAADQAAAFSVFASLRLSRSSFPARTRSMALPMPLFSLVSVT